MSDATKTADEAVSNTKLFLSAVWAWLTRHPALIATVFFVIGFIIG